MIRKLSKKKPAKRPPTPVSTSIAVRNVMLANKSKNTKPELIVRKHLSSLGIRGYRLHWKKAPGKPEIDFPGRKIAIIINGCFWHGCRKCTKGMPKTNTEFWSHKILGNRARDRKNLRALKREGWKTVVIWEHDIKRKNLKRLPWNITGRFRLAK